jgi:hypothetical protein
LGAFGGNINRRRLVDLEADTDFAGGNGLGIAAHQISNGLVADFKILHRHGFQALRVDRAIAGAETHDGAAFGNLIQ